MKKNNEHRRTRITKKRFKGLDKPPKYSSPTVEYTYERDYTFKCDQQVSINTLDGRVVVNYSGYEKHVALIRSGACIGDAKLWYDQPHKQFYLLVALKINLPDPCVEDYQSAIGIDAGIRVCQKCQYTLHADLVGARNLVMRTLVVWQDWTTTGHLSVAPDVSDKEAKAARLKRYAELRWSPEASFRLLAGGH